VVSIRGTVTGRVNGRQRIELLAGSKVQASLVSPKLVIEEGAIFSGQCDMGGLPKASSSILPLPSVVLAGGPDRRS